MLPGHTSWVAVRVRGRRLFGDVHDQTSRRGACGVLRSIGPPSLDGNRAELRRASRSRRAGDERSIMVAWRAEGARGIPASLARGRDEAFLPASRLPGGARGLRTARSGSDCGRLGCGRASLGGRVSGIRAQPHGPGTEPGAAGPDRRARRHRQRRQDGQAHRVCGWPCPGAFREGARPRHPRPRTARHLVDERHQRRSEDGHEGEGRYRPWAPRRRRRGEREHTALGSRQLPSLRGIKRVITATLERWDVGVAPDVVARRMGRRPGRLRPDIPQLQRVDTPGGSRADAVLRAKPDADPHPRQLRDPHE